MKASRRDFLVGTAAAGLAPYLPARPVAKPEAFTFVFVTDTHIGLKSNLAENGAMLAEIEELRPDFVVNGGDVTDYGWAGEYRNYRGLIAPLEAKGVAFHHIPGNHDVRWSPLGPKAFREGTGDPLFTSFDHKGCHFVLLDSTVPLSHYGHYEARMLRWLRRDLERTGPKTPVFVFTHHWIGKDGVMVDNELRLFEILRPYNIVHVFNGHGHSDLFWCFGRESCSMNRGLYQGSWTAISANAGDGSVEIRRRSGTPQKGTGTFEVLPTPNLYDRVGQPMPSDPSLGDRPDEIRVDGGPWVPFSEETDGRSGKLVPGDHRVTGRKGNRYADRDSIRVADDGKTTIVARRGLAGGVMSHLRLDEDRLLVSQMGGALLCADAATLRPIWEAATGGYCHSSPSVCGDLVVVGSADGMVHAFDRRSGKPRWTFPTGGPVYASATWAQGTIVIGSGDGTVYGLSPRGKRLWTFELPKSETAFVQSPAVTDGERVFLGAWDKALYALDAKSGRQLWRRECTDGRSFVYSPAIGNPLVVGDRIVVPANANILWAFSIADGELAWRVTSPGDKFGYSSPIHEDGQIYTGTLGDKGEVRCVDAANGEILWTCATGNAIYDGGPAIGDGWIAIGSVSGTLNIIDKVDGKIRAQRQLPTGHFLSTPVARGRHLWVATFGDELFRISVA